MKKKKSATFAKKSLNRNTVTIKIIIKLKTIVLILVNTEVLHIACNLKYSIPKEIPVVFHNGANYELVKEFEREFSCLGECTEKYKTFAVPITKEVKKICENG